MRRKPRQLDLDFRPHGGKRKGAGRKPTNEKPGIPHKQRAPKKRSEPLLVTVRLANNLSSLRRAASMKLVRAALSAARDRHGMRIIHYTVQADHLHLLVEADDRTCVARGMNALLSPLARALNKLWNRRGPVFPQRYHDEVISTPTQARNALRYVLQNGKKHGLVPRNSIDLCSSAPVFDGWKQQPSICATSMTATSMPAMSTPPIPIAAVAPATCWLLTTGWRRHGLIDIDEIPRPRTTQARRPRPNPAESSHRATSR
ncbi:MAG: transposase [Planctomycetes bacterium]|nr:transposase [Planctomycetota bacterium]